MQMFFNGLVNVIIFLVIFNLFRVTVSMLRYIAPVVEFKWLHLSCIEGQQLECA